MIEIDLEEISIVSPGLRQEGPGTQIKYKEIKMYL